jgi:hypothetical protein
MIVEAESRRLSLIIGGPFHGLLRWLRLTGADQLAALKAGAVLAAVAWLLPAFLAVLQELLAGDPTGLGYFSDPSSFARFFVGIFALIAVERRADTRLGLVLDNFREARLVTERDLPALGRALDAADRRTSSKFAEATMLTVALVTTGFIFNYTVRVDPGAWEGSLVNSAATFTWAGHGARWFSAPLLQFLGLRWIWRFICWAHLLFRVSRLPLQLSVTHPDRMGGLSFVSLYPPVFNGLVFAVGAALAASFIRDLAVDNISLETVQVLVASWVLFAVVLLVGPLLVFMPCLAALKDGAIVRYGRLAGELQRAFERKWLTGETGGEHLLESSDASAAADANAVVGSIWSLRVVPIELATVISVALAAGIPMLAVLATRMPVEELVRTLLGALF